MTATQDAPAVDPRPAALDPEALVDRIEAGHRLTAEEAVAVLDAPDADTFRIVAAASRLREKHFGRTVKVNYLVSLKTGLCPENCTYCSQRLGTEAEILRYTWLKPEEAVRQAGLGIAGGASRVCMVASGTGPTDRDVDRVTEMIGRLKDEHPQVEVCACLGKLKDGQGNYLWQPSFTEGQPQNVLAYPVTEMAAMPDVAPGAMPLAFGDFRRGYLIVARTGVRVLRDPFTNKPYVHFYTTKRVGGMLTDSQAIKVLTLSAAD